MAQSITLTASMRSNLSSLKGIQKQMNTTQERLSTGKKVNSAIDNASSFYQARSLTNRAADLDALLDSMGQGIQTIQAANEGIESVTSYVEQLKSVAQSAFAAVSGNPSADLTTYEGQYNTILTEMYKLIGDSSYQGINLLNGGDLTVTFDENRVHNFTVQGKTMTTDLQTNHVEGFSWNASNEGNISWGGNTAPTHKQEIAYAMTAGSQPAAGTDLDGKNLWVFNDSTKVWSQATGTVPATGAPTYYTKGAASDPTYVTGHTDNTTSAMYVTDAVAKYDANGKTKADKVNASLDAISEGLNYLRNYATELGNNFSIIETRQNFTEALIDVLETGSDNLTLADMNEESANYLALQTRQQLAINSLALASQSAQSVLSLFQ